MKAEDTVIGGAEIDTRLCNYAINFSEEDKAQIQRIAQLQAEISFKAGEKNLLDKLIASERDKLAKASDKAKVIDHDDGD